MRNLSEKGSKQQLIITWLVVTPDLVWPYVALSYFNFQGHYCLSPCSEPYWLRGMSLPFHSFVKHFFFEMKAALNSLSRAFLCHCLSLTNVTEKLFYIFLWLYADQPKPSACLWLIFTWVHDENDWSLSMFIFNFIIEIIMEIILSSFEDGDIGNYSDLFIHPCWESSTRDIHLARTKTRIQDERLSVECISQHAAGQALNGLLYFITWWYCTYPLLICTTMGRWRKAVDSYRQIKSQQFGG